MAHASGWSSRPLARPDTIIIGDQTLHFGRSAFDPLEEDPAAENQHPGYASGDITGLGKFDDAPEVPISSSRS